MTYRFGWPKATPEMRYRFVTDVYCTSCRRVLQVDQADFNASKEIGAVVPHDASSMIAARWIGVCPECSRPAPKPESPSLDLSLARLCNRRNQLREQHPEWSVEEVVLAAVAEECDPRREPNDDFRAWLLERVG